MKKINILLGVFVLAFILVGVSFVSASLCRGADGYYHDCDEFYYIGNDKVYIGESYYDRDKYSIYYDYRNKYYANYVPRHNNEDYYYEGYKDYTIEEKKAYDRGFKDGTSYGDDLSYSKGYDVGYRDGYNYGYYSESEGYRRTYEYYGGYESFERASTPKIVYFWRTD
ncbi:MAG: hypothetical protein ABIH37_03470 [archaeon]